MPHAQVMTFDEKMTVAMKGIELHNAGKKDEEIRYMIENFPMPPYLAKFAQKHYGAQFLIEGRFNLSEAEAEFGSGWLSV